MLCEPCLGPAPNGDCGLQATGPRFGEPNHATSKVTTNYGNFDESFVFKSSQIARKGRLLKSRAAREGAERVVR
jgi:hypothetical protein